MTAPTAGAILDLNRGATGGLLLSNVALPDLSVIPANTFVNISTEQDTNQELVGMIVYNTDATTGIGIHVWDGYDWIKPCAPPAPGPITFSDTTICGVGATVEASVTPVTGATGYDWTLPNGLDILATSPDGSAITIGWTVAGVYLADSIVVRAVSSSCGAGSRRVATQGVTVSALPTIPTGGTVSNSGNTFTFAVTSPPSGQEIDWYDAASGGNNVATGASFLKTLSVTTTYYAESRNTTTGCVSTSRLAVEAVVIRSVSGCVSTPNVAIASANVAFASGSEHTYNDLTFSPPVKIVGLPARTTQFDGGSTSTDSYKADYRDHPTNTDTYGSWFSWCMVKQYEDILCPGAWRVPTHAEFTTYIGGSIVVLFSSLPTNHGWLLGGRIIGSSMSNMGSYGYCWSSTVGDAISIAHAVTVTSSYVRSESQSRDTGISLRCVQ
ncbi:MAG: hypothetical protein LBP72_10340 [Dysgonamonadaceae bacterium]|nr:hypothetical protein [Dysgonamonadaceae bacterium]